MRLTKNQAETIRRKQSLFTSLIQEVQDAVPVSRLSERLKKNLEQIPREDRKEICGNQVEGCAPLFLACKNGSAEMVEYLVSTCDADIEQRGLYEVLEEGISHHVTPLWCAAVSGRLNVVKVLIRYGADVNAVSDSGSTPIRSACYIVRNGLNTAHFEIIKCLVRAGADIQQPNFYGGTCLINSVQSPELVKFLIDNNVNVNAEDVQRKTALHYAVQENRLETVKLLLSNGADPFKTSKYGDDTLQTACLKGSLMIFNHLLETVAFTPHRIADAFELIGTTFLLDLHDLGSTLFFWRRSLEIRNDGVGAKFPKRNVKEHPVLESYEIETQEELDLLSGNSESLKLQALMMTERILGPEHKDTIFRYMYSGAAYADANEYKSCVGLWNYALKLKVHKETLLSCDTSFTARAIVQLYVNIMMRTVISDVVHFPDVVNTAEHVNSGLLEAMDLLILDPVCKAQLDNFDIVLTTWVHLVLILLKVAETDGQKELTFALVNPILKLNPTTQYGDTVLHLAVSSSSTLKSNSFLDEDAYPLFPSTELVKYLLRCGFDIHARNYIDETPLHVASKIDNYEKDICFLLLDHGAHLDAPDSRGILPLDILQTHSSKVNFVRHLSLKCLAARVVIREKLDLSHVVLPPNMSEFLLLHV